MKNNENAALLAHTRRYDERRRAAAVAKRKAQTDAAIAKIRGAK